MIIAPDDSLVFACAPELDWIGFLSVGPPMAGFTSIDPGGKCRQLAIAPDGSRLFVPLDNTSDLSIIDAVTHQLITTVDLTETSDRWAIDVSADGTGVILAGQSAHHVIVVDAASGTVLDKVDTVSSSFITGRFLSPSYLVPGNALDISGDAGLTPIGFRDYVTMAGGTLRLLANWTTAKHLSSIQEYSHLDTNGFDASIAGTVNGDVTKRGTGTLTLTAVDIGSGNLSVEGGVLNVAGTYSGNVRAEERRHGAGRTGSSAATSTRAQVRSSGPAAAAQPS